MSRANRPPMGIAAADSIKDRRMLGIPHVLMQLGHSLCKGGTFLPCIAREVA